MAITLVILGALVRSGALGLIGLLKYLKYIPWQGWVVGGLIATGIFVYYKGEHNGAARVQTQWDDAASKAVAQGAKIGSSANAEAEKAIPVLTPADKAADAAIAPRGQPCRVRDPNDRDCAQH